MRASSAFTSTAAAVATFAGLATAFVEAAYGTAAGSAVASTAGSAVSSGSPASYPTIIAPYSNSTKTYGAGANGNYQNVTSTVYTTSTAYQTVVQTITTTDAEGAQSTEYVTKTVSVYTTVYPVSTVVSNSGSSSSANSGSSDSTENDKTGNSFVADTLAQVSQNAGYTAVTKTIYTTAIVTATIRQKAVTLTTTYPLTTTVEYVPASSGSSNGMTTSTTTIKTTFTNTHTVLVAPSAAPFAFTNGTGNALYAPSGSVAVNAAHNASSASGSGYVAAGSSSVVVISSSSASSVVVYQTQVVVPVAVDQSSSASAAASASATSNSRIYSAVNLPANDTTASYDLVSKNITSFKMKAVHTSAASPTQVEYGVCAIALLVGVFFVL